MAPIIHVFSICYSPLHILSIFPFPIRVDSATVHR